MKYCPSCKETLPLESFAPSCRNRNGTYCRACLRACNRRYVAANREHVKAYQAEYRARNADTVKAQAKTRSRAYYLAHRDTALAQNARWMQANKDKRRAIDLRYLDRNRAERYKKSADYWKRYPEKAAAHARLFRQRHPDRTREWDHAKRARRLACVREPIDFKAIWERDKGICHLCSEPVLDNLHYDHVVPLSRGGTHTMDNIKVSHARCNLRKSNKLLSELSEASSGILN